MLLLSEDATRGNIYSRIIYYNCCRLFEAIMDTKKSPAKSPRKRKLQNCNDLALIDKPTSYRDKTTVHIMITLLSPTKGKHFDGSILD